MAGSAGSIYVDLLLRDGRYRQGLNTSKQLTKNWSNTVKRDTREVSTAFDGVINPVQNVGEAIRRLGLVAAGVFSVSSIVDYSDRWKQIQGRLKLVVTEGQGLASLQEDLFDIAQRTRQPLESITNLYSRMGQIIPENVKGNLNLLDVTEGVSSALAITGETSLSAQAAIVQFTQALATDFQAAGQEIRSIQEQAPRLALAISRALGGGTKSLRELADAGKLSTESVGRVLTKGTVEFARLQKELAQIPVTVNQAFTKLNNSFLTFIGQSDAVKSGTNAIAVAITALADNIGLVVNAVSALSLVLGVKFVSVTMVRVSTALTAFKNSLMSVPPGVLAITSGVYKFNTSMLDSSNTANTLVKTLKTEIPAAFSLGNKSILMTSREAGKAAESVKNLEVAKAGLIAKTSSLSTVSVKASKAVNSLTTSANSMTLSGVKWSSWVGGANKNLTNLSKNSFNAVANITKMGSVAKVTAGATTALGTASLVASNSFRLLKVGASGLVSLLGGPLGAALYGTAAAFFVLSKTQEKADKLAQNYSKELEKVNKRLKEISPSAYQASDAIEDMSNPENWEKLLNLKELLVDIDEKYKMLRNSINRGTYGESFFEALRTDYEITKLAFTDRKLLGEIRKIQEEYRKTDDIEKFNTQINELAKNNPKFQPIASSILKVGKEAEATQLKIKDLDKSISGNSGSIPIPGVKPLVDTSETDKNASKIFKEYESIITGVSKEELSRREVVKKLTGLLGTEYIPNQEALNAAISRYDESLKSTVKASKEHNQEQERLTSTFNRFESVITGVDQKTLDFKRNVVELSSLLGTEYIPNQEALNEAVARLSEEYRDNKDAVMLWGKDISGFAEEASKDMESAFTDILFNGFEEGVDGMLLNFVNVLRRMSAEAASANIVDALFGRNGKSDSKGGLFGSIINSISPSVSGGATPGNLDIVWSSPPVFAGGRANGGPIPAGQFAIVGENGPELAFGGTTGKMIVPNVPASGGNSQVVNIDARGAAQGVEDKIRQVMNEVNALRRDTPNIAVQSVSDMNRRNPRFLNNG